MASPNSTSVTQALDINGGCYGGTNPAGVGPGSSSLLYKRGEMATEYVNIHSLDRLTTWMCTVLGGHLKCELPAVKKLLENPHSVSQIGNYTNVNKSTLIHTSNVVTSYTETPGTSTNYNFAGSEYSVHSQFSRVTASSSFTEAGHYELTSKLLKLNGNNTHVTIDMWQQASKHINTRAEFQHTTISATRINYTEQQVESFSANDRDLTGQRFIYSDHMFIQAGDRSRRNDYYDGVNDTDEARQGLLYHPVNTKLKGGYGNIEVKATGNLFRRINQNMLTGVGDNVKTVAGGKIELGALGIITIDAGGKLTIKSGAAIVLAAPAICLCGPLVPCCGPNSVEKSASYDPALPWENIIKMEKTIGQYNRVPRTQDSGSLANKLSEDIYPLAPTGTASPAEGQPVRAHNTNYSVDNLTEKQPSSVKKSPSASDKAY